SYKCRITIKTLIVGESGVSWDREGKKPEDDNHIYFVRFYELHDKKGRSASYGVMKLFDPDLKMVWEKRIKDLECEVHGKAKDGLVASEGGIEHGLIVKIPVKKMKKVGKYYFVVSFLDNHADTYKDHQVKPALELNAEWWIIPDKVRVYYYNLTEPTRAYPFLSDQVAIRAIVWAKTPSGYYAYCGMPFRLNPVVNGHWFSNDGHWYATG
ncbi:MAG: hypothetical protein NZ937_09835, partial [Armatimonadetes bacterium]|nr:hypothetical protein [Armatimonadota bacterium]